MKTNLFLKVLFICLVALNITASGQTIGNPKISEENTSFRVNGTDYKGYIAYDSNITGKRPAILVIPEWWGLNDYPEMRARKLAELGYVAMAVDMFGNGKIAANPDEAQKLTAPFYKDAKSVKPILDAALGKIKENPHADPANVAVIGYCFGGYVALNYAKLGADIKGVVSFHGGLSGGVPVDKKLMKAAVLICQGGIDKFVPVKDAENLRHKLDSIGAKSELKIYPNATHAFTNPESTATGKKFKMPIEYNPEADKNSWNDMKAFFGKIFGKS